MSTFLSKLRTFLTGEKTASSSLQTSPKPSNKKGLKSSDDVLKVLKEFFYSYHQSTDRFVTHVDRAVFFLHKVKTEGWLVALELSYVPGVVIWVSLNPTDLHMMLLYGDDAPDYEGYLLGLACATSEMNAPAEPTALKLALTRLVTEGYLVAEGNKLKYTGKIDPKQQKE